MSGHSKWANIKRKKEVNDKAKAKVFAKLSRSITMAVLEGGGITDPVGNVRLRLAIDKARELSMPKDNIQRAIEKGSGSEKSTLAETIYEAFGPNGVALIILVATDNSNRTHGEIRNILEKNNGKLAGKGAVMYLFQRCAAITLDKSKNSEEAIYQFAERLAALDMDDDGEFISIFFPFENIGHVKDLSDTIIASTPEEEYKPTSEVLIPGESSQKNIIQLIEALEEHDDVIRVFYECSI